MTTKLLTPVVALLISVLSGCGATSAASKPSVTPMPSSTPVAQIESGSLTVDNQTRTYYQFVPLSLPSGKPVPLMVVLHPCPATTGAQVAVGSHLDELATADHFVAVYPNGTVMAATGGTCWNAGTCCTGADDVLFISQLIDHLAAQLPIDKSRVWVAGFSYGAAMAYRVGCQLSDKVAAIAVVSGALVFSGCHPSRPVSVLMMQGTKDTSFPYQGDDSVPPVASVARLWAGLDGCAGTGNQSVAGIVTTTQWDSCHAGTSVRLEVIAGASHAWFGLEPNPIPGEPNASSTVWDFFSSVSPQN